MQTGETDDEEELAFEVETDGKDEEESRYVIETAIV